MDDYVIYNTQNHVLICRQHRCGIPPDWIARHFREQHKTISLEMRNKIIQYAKSLDLWEPELVTTHHDDSFMEGLVVNIGYQCEYEGCTELRSSEISMQKHCHKVHRWVLAEGIRWTKESYQTIFQRPRLKYLS